MPTKNEWPWCVGGRFAARAPCSTSRPKNLCWHTLISATCFPTITQQSHRALIKSRDTSSFEIFFRVDSFNFSLFLPQLFTTRSTKSCHHLKQVTHQQPERKKNPRHGPFRSQLPCWEWRAAWRSTLDARNQCWNKWKRSPRIKHYERVPWNQDHRQRRMHSILSYLIIWTDELCW